jgi:hypothetical protein
MCTVDETRSLDQGRYFRGVRGNGYMQPPLFSIDKNWPQCLNFCAQKSIFCKMYPKRFYECIGQIIPFLISESAVLDLGTACVTDRQVLVILIGISIQIGVDKRTRWTSLHNRIWSKTEWRKGISQCCILDLNCWQRWPIEISRAGFRLVGALRQTLWWGPFAELSGRGSGPRLRT